MSTETEAESERSRNSKAEETDAAIPESQLQRMHPDSILADEANPDQVLGQDSSEAAPKRAAIAEEGQDNEIIALKRASAASAIFSHDHSDQHSNSRPQSQSLASEQGVAPSPAVTSSLADASSSLGEMSKESLLAQVKDLTNQVTGLNEKLVRSFNRIADLEDDFSEAQERIRSMSTKIKELEKERSEHLDALNTGLLVEKEHVSTEMQRMMDRVIEETAQRGKAESDKSKIEAELDELSSSLFSEANKMVAVERLSRARAEEKSRNMEERLKDTEGIMLEQQKVLADLQRQVEQLQSGSTPKKASDQGASSASAENGVGDFHRLNSSSLARSISQRTVEQESKHKPAIDLASEARLIINIIPYQEFRSFIAHLRKLRKQLAPFYNYPISHPGTRESLNATPTSRTASPAPQQPTSVGAPSSSLPTATSAYSQGLSGAVAASSPFAIAGVSRHRDYPSLPSNVENMVSLPSQLSLPFIKRSQEEDVEPCLRLDFAPGLNWLSRRQANTAILDGNLVIEPIFSGGKTIDEDVIRRENAHLPPAACAMCGIPIVNVPLPGGVAAAALSAEQGGKTSLVSSSIATATSSWASSAASSLGSITGSGSAGGSGTITPRPSRGGLFASFRRNASSAKLTEPADSPSNPSATTAPEGEANTITMATEGLAITHLPVPTHIFRLSESAPTRYLLCPHHCLLRLRAACQYWGFVRNLERSVVLEGKFTNEEQQQAASASSENLPKEISAARSEQVETLENAVADATEAADDKTVTAEDLEAHKPNEGVQESGDAVQLAAESEAEESALTEDKKMESTPEGSPEAEKKNAGDDDDFADAPSSPTEAKSTASDAKADAEAPTKDAETTESPVPDVVLEASSETKEPTTVTEAASEKNKSATTDQQPSTTAPPLPPRSVACGTGAASPAPALPPRRHPRAADEPHQTQAQLQARTPAALPPAPTALYLNKLETMEWEDKMWTEITKLKEELWRARIGLVTQDGE